MEKEKDMLDEKKSINLERLAMTTLGYGFIGYLLNRDSNLIAPLTSMIGLGACVYDEIKQKGMDLTMPAFGMFFGGLIGSFFELNSNEYFPNALLYSGALIGSSLGFYNSIVNSKK
jgi:hypothetical protein